MNDDADERRVGKVMRQAAFHLMDHRFQFMNNVFIHEVQQILVGRASLLTALQLIVHEAQQLLLIEIRIDELDECTADILFAALDVGPETRAPDEQQVAFLEP